MKLGLENKKKAGWAAILGVLAVLVLAYEIVPLITGTTPTAASGPLPVSAAPRPAARTTGKASKKVRVQNLDPTLRLDLLAMSEQTQYEGKGRNIFVSQAEAIPEPKTNGATDTKIEPIWTPPVPAHPPPIPLKFYGFANQPGEPKKIFLSMGEDLFVAGEGEIVNRRYKVIRISPNSVEIQDVLNSGPPQSIPLTQG